jgi:hypothetical protein
MNTPLLESLVAEPVLCSAIEELNSTLDQGYLAGGAFGVVNHPVGPVEIAVDGQQYIAVLGCIDTAKSILLDARTGNEIPLERSLFTLFSGLMKRTVGASRWSRGELPSVE